MLRAHCIRLNPTLEQERYFWQCAGVARFAWNWALSELNAAYDRGERPHVSQLKVEFNRKRREEDFAPFVGDVQSYAYQQAFTDLQAALSRYHKLRKEGKLKPPPGRKPRKDGKPFGWPKFKSRKRATPAFYLANNGGVKFDGNWVTVQRCQGGAVNMAEPLRLQGKIMGGKVRYQAGHWYLSVSVDVPEGEQVEHQGGAVGVDLGLKHLAVTSDGQVYDNPKPLKRYERKLKRLQRKASRQSKGSKNQEETFDRIARVHARIRNLRQERTHTMTTDLSRQYAVIGLEDLNVHGMVQNHSLANAVSDATFAEIRRQLEYKAPVVGGKVVLVDRWFPSSKTCNACGHVLEDLTLAVRQWQCPNCGIVNNRDANASANIRDEALRIIGA